MDSIKVLKVSEMAENLMGSEIIKLAGEIKAIAGQGEKIYNFTIGDFDPKIFPIPSKLKESIIKAYGNDQTNYPAANGMASLRQAVSRFLLTHGGLEYNEEQILIAGGARPLIYAAYQTLIDPNDAIIYPVPSWNNNHYTHLSHGRKIQVITKAENNFMPSAADLQPHIKDAVLIALCSPLNPTGTVFSEHQLKAICDLILEENYRRGDQKKPVFLLYDQIYWKLTYGNTLHYDPVSISPEMKNYTVYIDGLSKAFAATGVRMGWAFGPHKIINKMKSVLGHIGAWAPKAEQVACAEFLQDDAAVDPYLETIKFKLEERLQAFYQGFQQLKKEGFRVDAIAPQAAMYLTVRLELTGMEKPNGEKLKNTEDISGFLLNEGKIALVPFSAFGSAKNSNWFRLSVGTTSMEDIAGFFENLREALEKLQ